MADRPQGGRVDRAPEPARGRLPWPRTPDQVATFTTLTANNGQNVEPVGCNPRGLYIVAGTFDGAQALGAANNWFDIFPGDVLPPGVALRDGGSFSGRLSMRWYVAENDNDLDELMKIAQLLRGGGSSGASAAQVRPNRSSPQRTAVGGGGTGTHTWTIAGFMFATIIADADNAAVLTYGSVEFPPGSAENEFVGDSATGFSFAGTPGDAFEIIEYGRS